MRAWVLMVGVAAVVSACGGGRKDEAGEPLVPAAQASGGPALDAQGRRRVATAVSASDKSLLPVEAAATALNPAVISQLLDFGETHYPAWFPSHQPDRQADIWTYRYYPETGIFLGVAFGQVYVVGGAFGETLVHVGAVLDFITPAPLPSATVSTDFTQRTPWNLSTAAQVTLRDAAGQAVAGALSCTPDDPVALAVSADCGTLRGLRLGTQTFQVRQGNLVAHATVKVIPQPQPLGSHNQSNFQLVVTPDGRVLAWGANSSGGQLGQGQRSPALASLALPTAVKTSSGQGALSGIVQAVAGEGLALALDEDGQVWSWGAGDGLGRIASNGDPLPGPVQDATGTAPLRRIVSVSTSGSNAAALADDGTVYTWGRYTAEGSSEFRRYPLPATLPGPAVAVSAGWNWAAALLADGRLMTWGYHSSGNMGQAAPSGSAVAPGFVVDAATAQPLNNVVAIAMGYLHGLALTANGQVFGWGKNGSGQLGQNDALGEYRQAVAVKAPDGSGAAWTGVRMVAAGGLHSLALDAAGQVYSWGGSQSGQLGDGANHPRVNQSALPAPVVGTSGAGALGGIVALAAADTNGLALAQDGSLLIWGSGSDGRLGQGGTGTATSYVPLGVKGEGGSGTLNLAPLVRWPNLLRRGIF